MKARPRFEGGLVFVEKMWINNQKRAIFPFFNLWLTEEIEWAKVNISGGLWINVG
jgi:hypothetical protein